MSHFTRWISFAGPFDLGTSKNVKNTAAQNFENFSRLLAAMLEGNWVSSPFFCCRKCFKKLLWPITHQPLSLTTWNLLGSITCSFACFTKSKDQYDIPKIKMLHNFSWLETTLRLPCHWKFIAQQPNLAFRQRKLHNVFIFGMVHYS